MKQTMGLTDVINNVKQGMRYLDSEMKPSTNYTILIGPTGAGKSTLTNVLVGNKIKTETVGGKKVFVVDGPTNIKIGHQNQSETERPNIVGNYIDCPGFGDTDSAKELQNAVYIKRVFGGANKEKILIVTEYSSIFSGKAQPFVKLLKAINESMGNKLINFTKQFGLIVSKVSSDDYDSEVTGDPSKISSIIQSEIASSTYPQGGGLIEALGDRMLFFMKNDSHSSISNKLKSLTNKIAFGDKIPIFPIISLDGQQAINSLIEQVFGKIINFDREAVSKYLYDTKKSFKLTGDVTYPVIFNKLKTHDAPTKKKLFEREVESIKTVSSMEKLVDSLVGFTAKVKAILLLSDDGLDSVKIIADIYPEADQLSQNYKLQIANIFTPAVKFEGKIDNLLQNVTTMDRDWAKLKDLTTPSNIGKGFAIAGGIIGSALLIVATGGIVAIVEGAVLTAGAIAGGALVTTGWIALMNKAHEACEAYKQSHPQVIQPSNELEGCYKKLPDIFAKLWAGCQTPEKSEYLPSFKIVLIGNTNDDYHCEYSEIFGN